MATGGTAPKKIPLLTEDVILYFLSESLGLRATKTNLQNPTPDFVRAVFESFLADFQIGKEAVSQPNLGASATIANDIDLYEKAIPLVTLYVTMKEIMTHCRFEDFPISDITNPKPKRIRRILSNLVNLWWFSAKKMEKTHEIRQEIGQQLKIKKEHEEKMDSLRVEINKMTAEKIELSREKEMLELQANEVVKDIAPVKQKSNELNSIAQDIKIEIAEFEQKKDDANSKLMTKKEVLQQQRKMSTTKPTDALLQECEDLGYKLNLLTEEHKTLNEELLSSVECTKNHVLMADEMSDLMKFQDEVLQNLDALADKAQSIIEKTKLISEENEELVKLEKKATQFAKTAQDEKEEYTKKIYHLQHTKDSLNQQVKELKKLYNDCCERYSEVVKLDEAACNRKSELEKELNNLQIEQANYTTNLVQTCRRILEHGRQLHAMAKSKTDRIIKKVSSLQIPSSNDEDSDKEKDEF